MSDNLWLENIPLAHRPTACAALQEGDIKKFLAAAVPQGQPFLVLNNIGPLLSRGLLEAAIIQVLATCQAVLNLNQSHARQLEQLLDVDDFNRDRARDAGDSLPGSGPFTVFRAAPLGDRGRCWMASRDRARGVAINAEVDLWRAEVDADGVIAYVHATRAFIVLPEMLGNLRRAD